MSKRCQMNSCIFQPEIFLAMILSARLWCEMSKSGLYSIVALTFKKKSLLPGLFKRVTCLALMVSAPRLDLIHDMYIYIYYIHVHPHKHMWTSTSTQKSTYIHAHIHIMSYAQVYIHIYTYIYIYTCIHPSIHTYIASRYIALHYITLDYLGLHYITLHYITYVRTYLHIDTDRHTYCTYVYIYTYIYVFTHLYIYNL